MSAPEGLRSEIPQALWKRKDLLWGLPTQWLALFVGGGGVLVALTAKHYGWRGALVAGVLLGGLFVYVQYRFRHHDRWDEDLMNDLAHLYQYYYGTE